MTDLVSVAKRLLRDSVVSRPESVLLLELATGSGINTGGVAAGDVHVALSVEQSEGIDQNVGASANELDDGIREESNDRFSSSNCSVANPTDTTAEEKAASTGAATTPIEMNTENGSPTKELVRMASRGEFDDDDDEGEHEHDSEVEEMDKVEATDKTDVNTIRTVPPIAQSAPPQFVKGLEDSFDKYLPYAPASASWSPWFDIEGVKAFTKTEGELMCVRCETFIECGAVDIFRFGLDIKSPQIFNPLIVEARVLQVLSTHCWVRILKFEKVSVNHYHILLTYLIIQHHEGVAYIPKVCCGNNSLGAVARRASRNPVALQQCIRRFALQR